MWLAIGNRNYEFRISTDANSPSYLAANQVYVQSEKLIAGSG